MNLLITRLRELRQEKDVPQHEIAKRIGISQPTYAGYETGRREPGIDVLIKIAQYHHVTVDYLVGYSDNRNAQPHRQPIPDNMIEVSPFEREVLLKYRVMPPSEQMYVCRMLQLTHPAQARANIKNA